MYGQEAHENITIAVAPKITVKNVEAVSYTHLTLPTKA